MNKREDINRQSQGQKDGSPQKHEEEFNKLEMSVRELSVSRDNGTNIFFPFSPDGWYKN